ncbi:MAG: alpha/beta hydrolase [Myxococcota bacterium]
MSKPLTLQTRDLPSGPFKLLDIGQGPTMVFVHGYPGRPQDFRRMLSFFADARCVLPAMPGLDLTPLQTRPQLGLAERAGFITDVIETLDLREITIVGHSMGGALSMIVANQLPERVQRLALLASATLQVYRGWRQASLAFRAPLLQRPPILRAAFRAAGFPRGISIDAMRHVMRCAEAMDFAVIQDAADALKIPTLIAAADDDNLIETERVDELAARCPAGPRLRFEAGGHALVKTQARPIADAIRSWMGLDE